MNKWVVALVALVGLVLVVGTVAVTQAEGPQQGVSVGPQAIVTTEYTYQGQLKLNGSPVNGTVDFQFSHWDAATAGSMVGISQTVSSAAVSDGIYTVNPSGGSSAYSTYFNGSGVWLQVAVRNPAGSGDYVPLSPRQRVNPVPYALSLWPGANVAGSKPDWNEIFVYNSATDNLSYGIRSQTSSPDGRGVSGEAWTPGGSGIVGWSYGGGNGVYGQVGGGIGWDISGFSTTVGSAVHGVISSTATGRAGYFENRNASNTYPALEGINRAGTGNGVGVLGQANWWGGFQGGIGVQGLAGVGKVTDTHPSGAYFAAGGEFAGPNGVIGAASSDSPYGYGVIGFAPGTGGRGVYGYATNITGTAVGVYGETNSPNGWAGYFSTYSGNGVYVSTPISPRIGLSVVGGTKNAVVRTTDGSRLLYAEEATQVWFADYGSGRLSSGAVTIPIDPIFAQTVNLQETYHVFVQAYGDADVYVTNRTATQFEVRARAGGDPNVEFSYRIVGKRLGHEAQRLERAPWADNDPNLYPEKAKSAVDGQPNPGAQGQAQPTTPSSPAGATAPAQSAPAPMLPGGAGNSNSGR